MGGEGPVGGRDPAGANRQATCAPTLQEGNHASTCSAMMHFRCISADLALLGEAGNKALCAEDLSGRPQSLAAGPPPAG
jgi:hypothetical protein